MVSVQFVRCRAQVSSGVGSPRFGSEHVGEVGEEGAALQPAGLGDGEQPCDRVLAHLGLAAERELAVDDELLAFREGLGELDLTYEQLTACLGGTCFDVYLNEVADWRCVPSRVWSYTIGGYQVMKKWLSYRERPLLGRDLNAEQSNDEVRYVTEMARRIAALLLLEPALDENYACVKADTYEWGQETPAI